ncbi:MAG: hypothetical protein HOG05_00785 [Bacteroidetes bacterium]|jgi:hypothetical protein|nr:hypothetical protein [Bacteroidota bacterium]
MSNKKSMYFIRGIQYQKFTHLHDGDELVFVHEPSNQHDPNAVAVFNKYSEKVGYISRTQTQQIHLILGKEPFRAFVYKYVEETNSDPPIAFAKILFI